MTGPLHRQAPTTRFSDRASDYARFRPSYPAEAIDTILDGLADPPSLVAADVGAGTGISARLLADRGVRVIAIEPNEAMRQAGSASQPPARGSIEWREGTAEATGLGDASADLVLCAQSYHWFEPAAACIEFGRILKPDGRLALLWNDADEGDPISKGYYDLVREASDGVGPTSHQTVARDPHVAPPFDDQSIRRYRFRNAQRFDESALIGRAMSASYVPKSGERAERLREALRNLHRAHAAPDGFVEFGYRVFLYTLELAR